MVVPGNRPLNGLLLLLFNTVNPLSFCCNSAGPSKAHDCIFLCETVWNLHNGHGNVELFLKHSRAEKLDRCSGMWYPAFPTGKWFLQVWNIEHTRWYCSHL